MKATPIITGIIERILLRIYFSILLLLNKNNESRDFESTPAFRKV
jgi:hypothetical protein